MAQERLYNNGRYGAPQDCRGASTCFLEGSGGYVIEWVYRYAETWVDEGKNIRVRGQCMSACAIALGYVLKNAPHLVRIDDNARIRPHNRHTIINDGWPMPSWFKRLLLRDLPDECNQRTCPTIMGSEINRNLGRG